MGFEPTFSSVTVYGLEDRTGTSGREVFFFCSLSYSGILLDYKFPRWGLNPRVPTTLSTPYKSEGILGRVSAIQYYFFFLV